MRLRSFSPSMVFLGSLVCVQLVTRQGNAAQADLPGKGVSVSRWLQWLVCPVVCTPLQCPFPPSPAGGTEALAALGHTAPQTDQETESRAPEPPSGASPPHGTGLRAGRRAGALAGPSTLSGPPWPGLSGRAPLPWSLRWSAGQQPRPLW